VGGLRPRHRRTRADGAARRRRRAPLRWTHGPV